MIVLDTSALVAFLKEEPQGEACGAILASDRRLVISAGTLAEALIVAGSRGYGEAIATMVWGGRIEVVPVTADTASRMARAYAAWGKGTHPAGLNFGDCFAYALAEETGAPILFIGQDFAQTDARSALS